MKFRISALALTITACGATPEVLPDHNTLTDAQLAEGWVLLFDGETTAGWRNFLGEGEVRGWEVTGEGSLVCTGGGGDLITEAQYEDFMLDLEWKIRLGGNSGIFFHVTEDHGAVWETGPEMQVLDNTAHDVGPRTLKSAGANYALHAPTADAVMPVGQFNRVRLIVMGGRVVHYLNGRKIVDYVLGSEYWETLVEASKFGAMPDYGRVRRGHIALQDHGNTVWFKNIRIKLL
jgi:hypothetical protein